MSSRKTPPPTQGVAAIAEQIHEGEVAAERHQVPRAVHVSHRLQHTDAADGKHHSDYEIRGRTPQLSQ
jgi:hypothetical protein